jgi:hypothetical protein
MIRLFLGRGSDQVRVLQDADFIREVEAHAGQGFTNAPPGPVMVEVLDRVGRLRWTAFYETFSRLSDLAAQLEQEASPLAGH